MGQIQEHPPALLLIAAFSRHEAAFDWAAGCLTQAWGPVALESDPFEFTETSYYEPQMGGGLRKKFLAFEKRIDPASLAEVKRQTNRWEMEYAALGRHAEPRPLNLDPGYLTPAKLVLASTKDYAHRIYLRDGIYAEITLMYQGGGWQPHRWTFPDYRRADYHQFFDRCRAYLKG